MELFKIQAKHYKEPVIQQRVLDNRVPLEKARKEPENLPEE